MDIYSLINSFNNKILFRNIIIILIFIYIFNKLEVSISVILGLVLSVAVIMYLYSKEKKQSDLEEEQLEEKKNTIKPKLNKLVEVPHQNDDLIDFLFSIQDFYRFNPQAYEEMVDNLEGFFTVYETIFNTSELSNYYYQIAESKKNNALNSLQSLIFTLPNEKLFTDKYDRAHKRLETIMNKYLNELYDRCERYLISDGYDIFKRKIYNGPKEYNHYFDKNFTYQFY